MHPRRTPWPGVAALGVVFAALGGCFATNEDASLSLLPEHGGRCANDDPVSHLGIECECQGSFWRCSEAGVTVGSECAAVYGDGSLLPEGCIIELGDCSDGRDYGIACDGSECTCTLDGQAWGEPFESSDCPNVIPSQLNAACGYNLKLPPGGVGGG